MISYYKDLEKVVKSKNASVIEFEGINKQVHNIHIIYDTGLKKYFILGYPKYLDTKKELIDILKNRMEALGFKDNTVVELPWDDSLDLKSEITIFRVKDTKGDDFCEAFNWDEKAIRGLLDKFNDVSLIREMIRKRDLRLKVLGLKDKIEEEYKYYCPRQEDMLTFKDNGEIEIEDLGNNNRNKKIIELLYKEYKIDIREFVEVVWTADTDEKGEPITFGKLGELDSMNIPFRVMKGSIGLENLCKVKKSNGDIIVVCI